MNGKKDNRVFIIAPEMGEADIVAALIEKYRGEKNYETENADLVNMEEDTDGTTKAK